MANGQYKQQRARQQLSCTACRTGKLKCDRQQPCDQCSKRSKDGACHYLPPPTKKRQNRNNKDRIAHLEGLVVQLMSRDGSNESAASVTKIPENAAQKAAPSKESPHSDDSSELTAGQLTYLRISSDGRSSYRGDSHWEAILGSIAELKDAVASEDDEDDDTNEAEVAHNGRDLTQTIIVGSPVPMTRDQLVQSVPPKHVADRLLWYWFNSNDPTLPIVHRPTFLAQYNQFWADSSSPPAMWLSLLYSIMSHGAQNASFSGKVEQLGALKEYIVAGHYQALGASALLLADYTQPQKYLLEALMCHITCEFELAGHGGNIWLMMSFIIRIALRMGYHRDPDNFPNLSVFDGEMRRRIWNGIYTFDVLQSYQEGAPNMLMQVHSDTKSPSNLLDTDFGPETKVLPQSRPLTELSPISYGVVKYNITKVFAQACDLSQSVQSIDYEQIESLDQELHKIYEQIPPPLRFSSMHQAFLDPPSLIFNRFKLELMFHKTRCVLHRRFMTQQVIGTEMELSRKLCVDAARSILKHHESIFLAGQDGGPLSSTRLYIATLNAADFLLAAMILCLELNLISKAPSPALAGPNANNVNDIRALVEKSHSIWKQPVNHFADTEKAVRAMEAMLRKMPLTPDPAPETTTTATRSPHTNGNVFTNLDPFGITPLPPFDTALSDTFASHGTANLQDQFGTALPVVQADSDFDWSSWDKLMLEHPDPNSVPTDWSTDFGNLLPTSGSGSTGIDPTFLNGSSDPGWPQVLPM